jgi:hypothetical protein
MIRVESRRRLQSLLGNIEHVFVFRHVVHERAERDCEQLFSHAEKAAKRYDGIRDPAGTGVDDDFLFPRLSPLGLTTFVPMMLDAFTGEFENIDSLLILISP